MRRLINLSSMFLLGLGLSLVASLSLISFPWQFWVIALLIGLAFILVGWYLDDFIMQALKVEPITYYGCFFTAIVCIVLALGVSTWLVSIGLAF